jgi:hypothetical protein
MLCAAIEQGASCIMNEGNCDQDEKNNLLSVLGSEVNYVNFNSSNKAMILTQLQSYYDEVPILCISKDIKYIIKYVEPNNLGDDQRPVGNSDNGTTIYADGDIVETPRLCAPGYIGSALGRRAGCCTQGNKLVGIVQYDSNTQQVSSTPIDQSYSRYLKSYVACCPSSYSFYAVTSGSSQGICVKVQESNIIDQISPEETQALQSGLSGISLKTSSSINDLSSTILKRGIATGAYNLCPSDASCAVIEQADGCVTIDGSTNCITPATNLTTFGNTMSCKSCFYAGEAIGVAETGEQLGKVAICQSDGTLNYVSGVNGSLSDTEACLKSEGGVNGENYQYCKQCRESGGTWSGLGCVDSTPTGLITWVMRIAYGVMGGVALIQFIIAGVYYQTGQEEKVKEARKGIIATLTGLAVLTFSILILRVIGINILDILPTGSF